VLPERYIVCQWMLYNSGFSGEWRESATLILGPDNARKFVGTVTTLLSLAATVLLSEASFAQNLIANGNFGTNGGDFSFNSAPPWSGVGFGYLICTVGQNCSGGATPPPGGTSAYALITPGSGGGVAQTVTLSASGRYEFSFYHIANYNSGALPTLNVTIGGQTIFNGIDHSTTWALLSKTLKLNAGANLIEFIGTWQGGYEDLVDDIRLIHLGADVSPASPVISFLQLPQGAPTNAVNVAAGINGFLAAGGSFSAGFQTLTALSGQPLVNALQQLSGEAATGSQQTTFDAMNLFIGTMLDPFTRGSASAPGGGPNGYAAGGDASAYASDGHARSGAERDAYAMFTKAPPAVYEQRWSTWVAGFGGSQSTDGNAAVGSNNTTSSVYGTAVGADYRFSPDTVAGFAMAGGGTNFSVANSGSGHSDLFQFGAFVKQTMGPAYISAALAYGWQDITTNRTVTVAGSDLLRAQFDANAFSGRLEGGYRFVAPWVGGIGITPYAAAQFTTFDLPAYAEQTIAGSNAFALANNAKDVTDSRSELGIRSDKPFAMSDGVLILRSRFAWAHDYNPDRSIAATFQTLPGASFVVNGAAQAADSALVTAGLEKKWLNGWSAAVTFEGEFSDVTRSYAGKGVVRYTW
jgi:uncharacterized protein with beta-barrel porin domain